MSKSKQPMKGVTSITKNSVEYWYARIDGEKKYCGKGNEGFELAKAARSKFEYEKYRRTQEGVGVRVKKSEFKTLKDMINWYMLLPVIQESKSYRRKTHGCVHLLKYFGEMKLAKVDADTIDEYRQWRADEGANHGTIDLEIRYLRAIYGLSVKRKKISATLMPGEFRQKRESNPRPIISDEDFNKLLEHSDADFVDFLTCGYETGMRLKEICNLTSSQIHLDIQHISGKVVDYIDLGIFDTKTGARRNVPVCSRLKNILIRRMDGLGPDELVFTYGGGKKYYSQIVSDKLKKQVCKKAKIPYGDKTLNQKGERTGFVFHCLRHTRTTKWVEMGFSDEIIRRATGHKSLEAYQNYIKLDPSAMMRLVESEKAGNSGIKYMSTFGK